MGVTHSNQRTRNHTSPIWIDQVTMEEMKEMMKLMARFQLCSRSNKEREKSLTLVAFDQEKKIIYFCFKIIKKIV